MSMDKEKRENKQLVNNTKLRIKPHSIGSNIFAWNIEEFSEIQG